MAQNEFGRIHLYEDGELTPTPEESEETATPEAPTSFSLFHPLRAKKERERQRAQELREQELAAEAEKLEKDWQETINTILFEPIKAKLIEKFDEEIIAIFEKRELKPFSRNNQVRLFPSEHDHEPYYRGTWTAVFRVAVGPELLLAFNALFVPDRTTPLTPEEIASSPFLRELINDQYSHIRNMGYSIDSETLGMDDDEVLALVQEYAIEYYNTQIEILNTHYFCAYGDSGKMKRKRS